MTSNLDFLNGPDEKNKVECVMYMSNQSHLAHIRTRYLQERRFYLLPVTLVSYPSPVTSV